MTATKLMLLVVAALATISMVNGYTATQMSRGSTYASTAYYSYTDVYAVTAPSYDDIILHLTRTTTFSSTSADTVICYLGYNSPSSTSCYSWNSYASDNSTFRINNVVSGRTYYIGVSATSYSSYSYQLSWCSSYGCSIPCVDDCNGHGACINAAYSFASCSCDYHYSGAYCGYYYSSGSGMPGYGVGLVVFFVFIIVIIAIVSSILGFMRREAIRRTFYSGITTTTVPYQTIAVQQPVMYTAGAPPPPPMYAQTGAVSYGATYTPH